MNQYDDFEKWVDQWDAALKTGAFDTPKNQPMPSAQSAPESFFGIRQSAPSADVKSDDARYWSDVYKLSRDFRDDDYLGGEDHEVIQEEVAVDTKKMAKSLSNSPNPIRPSSIGMDQDIRNPLSVGATYDVSDLTNLEALKVKLHGLLDKLNAMEGRGQSGAKLESQIQSLQRQIDEFSDNLATSVPSQQGD